MLIGNDSLIERVIIIIRNRKADAILSLYKTPNPDPFQYGMRVGRVMELETLEKEISFLMKGNEDD